MMMTEDPDGPPNKRSKIGGPINPNDNNAFNLRALEDFPDGLLGSGGGNMVPSAAMMSHQPSSQQPIHETHQNLTALLSTNPPSKEVNHSGSMNNTMVNTYSGPGPGQYHNNMIPNGLSSANYASPGYNAAVSFSGSNMMCGSPSISSSNYSVSNSMPHTSVLSNAPPNMNTMQNQQLSGMVQQNQQPSMQQQPGLGMMNGPSSAMSNMNNRALPNNNMTPRLPHSQSMNNSSISHHGNGSMPGPGAPGQQMIGSGQIATPRPSNVSQPNGGQVAAISAKRKQLQQQLVLLLHAHKCQRREQSNGEVDRVCTLMYCKTMKGVLQHMTACTDGTQCQVAHCVTSRQIIEHWRSCNRSDCPVCLPLKSASDKKKSSQANSMLNSLVQNNQTGGSNSLNVNGLDLPNAGPALSMPPQGPPSMSNIPGNMPPPPNWPQQPPTQQPIGVDCVGQSRPPGLVVSAQPRGPLPNTPNVPSSASGSQPQSVAPGPVNSQPSAPEMIKAYDALGLPYPGTGMQHSALPQHPVQRHGQLGVGCITSSKDQPTKEWHKNVAIDLRNHLVHKLVQAIFPSPQPEILNDPRMTNLIHYARKVEMEMYFTASSRENYYHMLAEKIYKIQKELEQKRESRRQQMKNIQAGSQAMPVMPSSQPGAGPPELSQLNNMAPLSNAGSINSNMNGPNSVQSNPGGPGSVPSYSGPPSAGPQSIASASMMSPPIGGSNTGMPVSKALQESKNDFHEARRRQQMQQSGNEFKTEVKTEPDVPMDVMSGNEMKAEIKSEPVVKEEPRSAPHTPKPDVKDIKDVKPATPSTQPKQPTQKKVFTADELRQAFVPLVQKLLKTEESVPFRQPVDAQALNIPDYHHIIKNPMDLQSIQNKLDAGSYDDPWQFCDDVWLMFDNCWAYNRKTSRVYKSGSKLAEIFEVAADTEMQKLGFCCSRRYVFHPQTLCCYGKQLCTINREQVYYSYENRYVYCEKCFDEIQSDIVNLSDEVTGNPVQLQKSSFTKQKNDHLELEKFTACTDCGRKLHSICVQHMDAIWPQGYTCEACLKTKGAKRKDNRFTGKRLPTCKLSIYLESRVNNFLKKKNIGAGEVIIRVLASGDKETEMKPGMKERFPNLPASYPYRTKAMFAFEEIDGQEVCFFGMHVQEYDDKCCQPNRGRVYISYLDSVHFFQPREYRTAVYHEILIGYLDYSKSLGFNWGHIWACPPSEGDDYIFHCHPSEQKIPKPKRLQDWYKKMLDKAIIEGVVVEYKDIYKDAVEKSLQCVTDVPYFEGDFWPNVLEESIRELEQEEQEKRKRDEEIAAAQDDEGDFVAEDEASMDGSGCAGKKQAKKAGQKKKGNKKGSSRKNAKKPAQQNGSDLSSKVLSAMEKYREVFFVIQLQPHALTRQDVVTDPDPLIACDLMDGRDAFLTMARDKHWEFSSLRRTKYSTMAMLHEIHTSSRDSFVYTCNLCQGQVETRYHCTTCDDYDLCVPCYQKEKHVHPMERLGLDLDGDGNSDGAGSQTPAESRKISIQRCIQQLVHACQCRDANCRQASCQKMKKVVQHTRSCKKRSYSGCSLCKQLVALCCFHAKSCSEGKCPVPFCPNIKQKLKQQQQAARKKQAYMLRRRMQAMITRSQTPASSTPPSAPSAGSSSLQHSKSQSSHNQVPSPYTGKSMQNPAPAAALSAAQHALDAARQQTHVSSGGGKSMAQLPPSTLSHQMPSSMGKPQQMPLNPGNNRMPQQLTPQSMSSAQGMQPNNAQMGQGFSQMPQRDSHPGMSQSHGNMPQSMQHTHDQWGGQTPQPPPVYTPSGRPPHMPAPHPGSMVGPMPPGQQQMTANTGGLPNSTILKKLEMALKSPTSPQQCQDVTEILKRNPYLIDAFMKRKKPSGPGPHVQHSLPQQQPMPPQAMPPQGMPPQGMPQAMRPDMWGHRRPPMHYQQAQNPNYQQSMGARTMLPPGSMHSQYGMGQPRYHTPDNSGGMSQQQVMRSSAPHNQLLQQVRSPTSLQHHTRSPQPIQSIQSPRQQASASPALMQPTDNAVGMAGMMQAAPTSAQHNFSSMNTGNMPHMDYGEQQGAFNAPPGQLSQLGPDNGSLTPQDELTNFVDKL